MQILEDSEIVQLFHQRDQRAIRETESKYGALGLGMASNLTGSRQDGEECVNDALMRLWDKIPPAKPESLGGFFMTVCRRIALDKRKEQHREKRGGGQAAVAFEELSECIASPERPEEQIDRRALSGAVSRFLDTLPAETRVMFILRYWSCLSVQEVAAECGAGESKVKMTLLRTRKKLKDYLEQEGFL
ncbi:MAG: RNA polymerase sigma factor [Oscillospiraceae bacterium]|nr:RNA polymerase sigma factor [Oscillospiraceae bacterium]